MKIKKMVKFSFTLKKCDKFFKITRKCGKKIILKGKKKIATKKKEEILN